MRNQSQLDEMQQAKLMKINSNGMNLCYGGLLAAILIQWLTQRDFASIMGEAIVFFLLVIYIACAYIYEGIWSSKMKPSFKTNLLISLIPAAAVGILFVIRNRISTTTVYDASIIALAMAIAYIGCLTILSTLLLLYRRRRNILDDQENL